MRNRGPCDKQQVLRILCQLLGRRLRALPIGRRHHHQLVHVLHVPAALAKLDGQPVKQFGMRRPLPHDAEVFCGLHQAGAEQLVPHAIHGHARRQRILRAHRPLRQRQAIVRLARRQRRQISAACSPLPAPCAPCKRRASAYAHTRWMAFPTTPCVRSPPSDSLSSCASSCFDLAADRLGRSCPRC